MFGRIYCLLDRHDLRPVFVGTKSTTLACTRPHCDAVRYQIPGVAKR